MPTVRVSWDDVNSGISQETGVLVYRSETALDPDNLPAPLASLSPDVITYDDTTALADTTYFYGVANARGNVIALGTEQIDVGDGMVTTSTFTQSVRAGRFSVDLVDFAAKINLANAGSAFWAAVARADGGDIRVLDGSNAAIPFDLIEIDTVAETGLLVAKQTIATAAITTFQVVANNNAALAPIAAAATGGQHETWTAHDVVLLLKGDMLDRTANANDGAWTGNLAAPTYISGDVYGAGGGFDASTDTGYIRIDVPEFEGETFDMFTVCALDVDPATNPIVMASVATFGSNSDRKMLGQRDSSGEWTYISTSNDWEESGINVVLGEVVSMSSQSRPGVSGEQDGAFYLNGVVEQTFGSGDIGRDVLLLGTGRGTSDSDWPGRIWMGIWSVMDVLRDDEWFRAMDLNWKLDGGLFEPEPVSNIVVGIE